MFLQYLLMAAETLRANKLRTALTLLGMVIGVFSVIASVTAVQVIDDYFTDAFAGIGATTFFVQKYPAFNMGPIDASIRNRPDLTYEQLEQLRRRVRLAAAVSPDEYFETTEIKYGDQETPPKIALRGVDEEWALNNGYEVAEGRFLTANDVRYARPVIVLPQPIADELFIYESPLGKTVLADGRRYQVVGLLEAKGSILGESQDELVLAPITTLFNVYGGAAVRDIGFDVRATNMTTLDATIDEVIGQLRAIRRLGPGEPNNFEIVTNDALSGPFKTFTGFLTLGGLAIGLIALLAAGVGIMNIMLVSVTERTREIGIRKSLGATRRAILIQFLLEAVFLCQLGGLLGILLGVAGGNLVTVAIESLTPTFPWGWAFTGVAGVTLIAVVFGVYPAYKAARLDPIEALRYE